MSLKLPTRGGKSINNILYYMMLYIFLLYEIRAEYENMITI